MTPEVTALGDTCPSDATNMEKHTEMGRVCKAVYNLFFSQSVTMASWHELVLSLNWVGLVILLFLDA